MDVFEAIQMRRSVRGYLPDPVPEDKLKKILEAGRLAPSAMNLQPWHFIVVTDELKRKRLSEGRYAKFLTESPVVIVGCGNRRASPRWHVIDTAIAVQNMVLAATEEGLGTCWIGSFDEEDVKKLLNIPKEFSVIILLAIGYPRERMDLATRILTLFRRRKELKEVVSREAFGAPYDRRIK